MSGSDIFYEKDGNEFVLVHQAYDDPPHQCVLYQGRVVAIGFTSDPNGDERGIQFTTHRHGSPVTVEEWAETTRFALHRRRFTADPDGGGEEAVDVPRSMLPRTISSDQWDIGDLNRIISTTGSLGAILAKMGIKLSVEA